LIPKASFKLLSKKTETPVAEDDKLEAILKEILSIKGANILLSGALPLSNKLY